MHNDQGSVTMEGQNTGITHIRNGARKLPIRSDTVYRESVSEYA